MSEQPLAVADGREVASGGSPGDRPSVELLLSMLRALETRGYRPILVADEELRHQIATATTAPGCWERADIREVGRTSDLRQELLRIADDARAVVVSNDGFEEYRSRHPWIADRRIPYRLFQGEIYLDPVELMGVF